MSKYNCYLCASDEGILLDIFGDAGKTCRENIETCLSVKIKQSDAQSTKICHKCVYELDSCGKFLHNYRRSRDSKEGRGGSKRGHCSLCGETGKKIHLLEVKKGISLKNLLYKVGQVFEDNLFKDKTDNLSVCLDCRYNLDVLFDLKSIHQEIHEKIKSIDKKDLKLSDLSKTRTSVVSRKTTYIPLPRLNGNPDYDSDESTSSTMSLKHKRGKLRKKSVGTPVAPRASSQFRSCEECNTQVEYGIDMYRYHRTGLTVCKECWLTMDPEKMSNGKRKRFGRTDSESGTKLCAVFLKDVLSNPSKYNSIYKIETDNHGNTTFLITDDSSENEDKTPPKRQRGKPSTSSVPSLETTAVETKKTFKRLADSKKTDKEYEPPKKIKASAARVSEQPERSPSIVRTRTRNGLETDSTTSMRTRTRRRSAELVTKTEITVKVTPETPTNSSKKSAGRKLGRPAKATAIARKISSDEKSQAGDSSSNEIKVLRNTRGRRSLVKSGATEIVKLEKPQRSTKRTRSNSLTSQEAVAAAPLASRLSALFEDSTPSEPRNNESKRRALRNSPKNAKSDSELEKPYTCSVCRVGYKNKLIGKAHELTHEKQPEVKLQRVVIPEVIVEEMPVEVCLVEEPEEQSHDVSSTSDHKLEDSTVDATIAKDGTSLVEGITKNKGDSEGTKESALPDVEALVDDEKLNDVEDVESNEKNKNEEATETTRVKETPVESVITEVCENIDDIDNKENNENENKENNESEIKENDENENKENDENENKENNESENKENDENENKENDENENRNESNAENLDNVEEASVVAAETREKRDDESEKPDSRPSEERKTKSIEPLEKSTTEKVEAEKEPVNGKEEGQVDGTLATDEAQDVEKKSEASSEADLKNVVANSVESDERKVDDASTTREEPSEETEQIDEAEIAEASEIIDSTAEKEKKKEGESPRNEEDKEDAESLKNEDKDKGKESETLKNEEANSEAESLGNKEDKEKEAEPLRSEEDKEKEKSPANTEDKEKEKSPANTEDKEKEKSPGNTEDKEMNKSPQDETREENSTKTPIGEESEPTTVVTEILREVFDLASAEVKKRLENKNLDDEKCSTDETLENISLEIQNSADMPALELDEQAASNNKS